MCYFNIPIISTLQMRRNVGKVFKNCLKSYDKPQKNFNLSLISDFDLHSKTHSKSIYLIYLHPSIFACSSPFFNAAAQVMFKNRNPLFNNKQIIKCNFLNHSPQIANNLDPVLYWRSHLVTFTITVFCHIIHWITLSIFPLRFRTYGMLLPAALLSHVSVWWLAPNQR